MLVQTTVKFCFPDPFTHKATQQLDGCCYDANFSSVFTQNIQEKICWFLQKLAKEIFVNQNYCIAHYKETTCFLLVQLLGFFLKMRHWGVVTGLGFLLFHVRIRRMFAYSNHASVHVSVEKQKRGDKCLRVCLEQCTLIKKAKVWTESPASRVSRRLGTKMNE